MKRYKYSTYNNPETFSAALDYLKMTKEFTGTVDDFLVPQDIWSPIPTNIDMYFMFRPYLEIMGLESLADKELNKIGVGKYYPYDKKYGYYAPMTNSGDNIIQIPCPKGDRSREYDLVPYDEWETDKEAIKWLSNFVIEEIPELEIEMVPPVGGVMVE